MKEYDIFLSKFSFSISNKSNDWEFFNFLSKFSFTISSYYLEDLNKSDYCSY